MIGNSYSSTASARAPHGPNMDGNGFVDLGRSSSDLTKDEFSDLMELIAEFGARHGVLFAKEEEASAA